MAWQLLFNLGDVLENHQDVVFELDFAGEFEEPEDWPDGLNYFGRLRQEASVEAEIFQQVEALKQGRTALDHVNFPGLLETDVKFSDEPLNDFLDNFLNILLVQFFQLPLEQNS